MTAVSSHQPVRFTWLSMCFTSIAAGATLVNLGEKNFNNGWRPFRQWLKLERIIPSYNVTTSSGTDWTLEVYDNGVLVVDEDFTRTGTGWKTVDREIDVAIAANDASTPGIVTVKTVNPAGTTLTNVNILVEGYLIAT